MLCAALSGPSESLKCVTSLSSHDTPIRCHLCVFAKFSKALRAGSGKPLTRRTTTASTTSNGEEQHLIVLNYLYVSSRGKNPLMPIRLCTNSFLICARVERVPQATVHLGHSFTASQQGRPMPGRLLENFKSLQFLFNRGKRKRSRRRDVTQTRHGVGREGRRLSRPITRRTCWA